MQIHGNFPYSIGNYTMSDNLELVDIKLEAKSIIQSWFSRLESADNRAKLRAAINAYSGHIEKSFLAQNEKKVAVKKVRENKVFLELKSQIDSGFSYSIEDCNEMIEELEDGEDKNGWIKLKEYLEVL